MLLTCQVHVYLHKFVVERAMYLFVCREKRDLASTLWQPDITASLAYAKGGRSTCAVDTFFFFLDPSPLHRTRDFVVVGLLR